jgi:hypothetical protein
MRWLMGLVIMLGVLWCGYWFVGARGFEAGAAGWFANVQEAGKEARYERLDVRGFPYRFDLTVTAPEITDSNSGIAWQAPFFQILSLSYKPWHVIAAFPPEQRITLPQESMTLRSETLRASVVVQPVPSLPLDRVVLIGDGLTLLGDHGWHMGAASVHLATRRDETRQNTHEIGLEVTALRPDATLMSMVAGMQPEEVALLRVTAKFGLNAPIDRFALQTQPQIALLELDELRVEWGSMTVAAKGRVQADASGFAEGEVVLQLENWRVALDVAEAMGLIAARDRQTWDQAASFLALGSSDKDAIQLPLQFRDGMTLIGPIPVSPAPRLR